ncbi:MAG: PQQ-dependent sugar dehydrogenase, partial [Chloroflexi bacterium]|nr:PQQ-dependent sugar dehydrogenase [Chloroflexota bacterium]
MTHFRSARARACLLARALMAALLTLGVILWWSPNHGDPVLELPLTEADTGGFQLTGAAPPLAFDPPSAANLALPIGFAHDVIATNVMQPTGFAFLPDGRILIAEKRGVVRVIKDGALLPAPLIDIHTQVNDHEDRGLMSIAPDADFKRNGYVYLLYTYENNAVDHTGPKTARLTRVTATGDIAAPGSETVVLGTTVGRTCNDFPAGTDCLSSDGPSHTVGAIRVAPDGALFVSIGESGSFTFVDDNSLRAQDLDRLAGKLLHITPSGAGLPTNPFWNGDPAANRSKVWAYGFRNPFRFGLHPTTGAPYVGDPGWANWEEINAAVPGGNFGWPCYEGAERQRGFQAKPLCQALYAKGPDAVRAPLIFYPYYGRSAAVIGGAFVNGGPFPAAYQGGYLYADYAQGFIRMLRFDGSGALAGPPRTVAFVSSPVDVQMGPDGALYYLTIYAGPTGGRLGRIRYVGDTGCKTWQYSTEYFNNATLSGAPVLRQCDDYINYNWRLGKPGDEMSTDNFSARWNGRFGFRAGSYTFVAQADDGVRVWVDGQPLLDAWPALPSIEYKVNRVMTEGEHEVKVEYYEGTGRAQARVTWTPDSTDPQPRAVITSPSPALKFKVGDTIAFAGTASDAAGNPLPAGALSWQVMLHHCREADCHSHPFASGAGAGGSFTVTDHDDGTAFEVRLTARRFLGGHPPPDGAVDHCHHAARPSGDLRRHCGYGPAHGERRGRRLPHHRRAHAAGQLRLLRLVGRRRGAARNPGRRRQRHGNCVVCGPRRRRDAGRPGSGAGIAATERRASRTGGCARLATPRQRGADAPSGRSIGQRRSRRQRNPQRRRRVRDPLAAHLVRAAARHDLPLAGALHRPADLRRRGLAGLGAVVRIPRLPHPAALRRGPARRVALGRRHGRLHRVGHAAMGASRPRTVLLGSAGERRPALRPRPQHRHQLCLVEPGAWRRHRARALLAHPSAHARFGILLARAPSRAGRRRPGGLVRDVELP